MDWSIMKILADGSLEEAFPPSALGVGFVSEASFYRLAPDIGPKVERG